MLNYDANIYYRYNTDPNDYTKWSERVNLTQNNIPYSTRPDIAIDWMGRPHIVWDTWYSTDIWWSYCDSVWIPPVNISNNPGGSQQPCFVSDTLNNKLYIVWADATYGGNLEIVMKIFEGDTWSQTQRVTYDPESSTDPRVTVDSKGHLHLVWMDFGDYDIHYSEFDGDTWSTPENISNLAGQSYLPAIAIDPQDRPNAVWEERSGGSWVYYTRGDSGSWSEPYLISDNEGCEPCIAIGTDNQICVLWGYTSGEFCRFYENGSWGGVETIDTLLSRFNFIPHPRFSFIPHFF